MWSSLSFIMPKDLIKSLCITNQTQNNDLIFITISYVNLMHLKPIEYAWNTLHSKLRKYGHTNYAKLTSILHKINS